MQYTLPAADIHIGHKVDLREHGLDGLMTVLNVYRGRPAASDTLPGGYDLSKLDVDGAARNGGEEGNPGTNEGVALIVVPKSGDKGAVIYIADDQREVSITADNEGGDL